MLMLTRRPQMADYISGGDNTKQTELSYFFTVPRQKESFGLNSKEWVFKKKQEKTIVVVLTWY